MMGVLCTAKRRFDRCLGASPAENRFYILAFLIPFVTADHVRYFRKKEIFTADEAAKAIQSTNSEFGI